ncbi:MAG: hypothetical protein K8F57_05285 [Alphaproteobacteria bacterium]|nr:hypothetical protein [Alphaproteobacteria bacterium]
MERVREALSRLATTREMDGRVVVDLPIMYPSGAMVVVQVERNGDKVLVSDMGCGLVEAELSAADEYYGTAAKKAAEAYSVGFDGYAIFALWVPIGRIESAIVCVGNASCRAASEAVRRASEVQSRSQNERIFDRIARVFGKERVSRTTEIAGQHVSWEAHNVIVFPNRRRAVFEYMTNHTNSVSNKFMMFSDIRAADSSISLNSVVKSLDELGEKAQMVGDVANIVPLKASDEQFRQFAEAS